MASKEQLQTMMRAQPFEPFVVRLSSGLEFTVRHPDFVAYSPDGTEMSLYDPKIHLIDLLLVELLEPVSSQPKQP